MPLNHLCLLARSLEGSGRVLSSAWREVDTNLSAPEKSAGSESKNKSGYSRKKGAYAARCKGGERKFRIRGDGEKEGLWCVTGRGEAPLANGFTSLSAS